MMGKIKWGVLKVDHNDRVERMSDGGSLGTVWTSGMRTREWELEELQRKIQHVTAMKKLVTLTLWDNNMLHDETGLITGTGINKKELLLETEKAIKRITFDKIQNAEIVDVDD